MTPFASLFASLPDRYSPRRTWLVAVSGGRDSMALLHGLAGAGYRRLVVCHLNHRLRGRAATEDENLVRRTAARLGFRCECGRSDVAALAAERGISVEEAGRHARHTWFAQCAAATRCRRIFLAHHADDQVETVLLHLFRGSGGLRGMSEVTPLTPPGARAPIELIRPMLGLTRADLAAATAEGGWKFRHDAANDSPAFTRNRLRLEAIPLLNDIFRRDVAPSVLRALALSREASAYLDQAAQSAAQSAARSAAVADRLSVAALRALPPAVRHRALTLWLRARGVPRPSLALTLRVEAMLNPASGPARQDLPGRRTARRRAGWLWIE